MSVRPLACGLFFICAVFGQAPSGPPKVVRIFRDVLKPGRAAAQEKLGTNLARAAARAKYPVNYLALNSVSGESEVWLLEAHDSFASIENAHAFVEKTPVLKWFISQYEAQEGELVSSSRRMLAAYRQDLTYRGAQSAQDLPKMRFLSVVMLRLHPARDAEFSESVKAVTAAYETIKSDQPLVIYQVVSGAEGPTFLFLTPMASLKAMDDAALRGKALREALGEERAAGVLKTSAEVTASSESLLLALNPRLSYVSKEFASADPDFWIPKPPPQPAPPTTPVQPSPGSPAPPAPVKP